MKHPTRQQEFSVIFTRALSLAATEAAPGDPAKACALMDRWIEQATREYAGALALENIFVHGSGSGEPPTGINGVACGR